MRTIELLDQNTIDKIAAGEVVERPASIVKELVENALDADSTAITVEIKEGGISFIRITDNGCGIPMEQIRKAFLRHATSKIRSADDLVQIASLGFRGEALSSISAVAQVELITKTPEALSGVRYCIDGGKEKSFEEIGAPSGTTFLVRNLFFNTPARAKFLKSAASEGNAVNTVVEQLALSHPDVSFKSIMNGQNKLYTNGNGNIKEIIYQIYGRELTKELLELNLELPWMKVSGFIGKPTVARGNRNFENYFVNGRYVKSKLLAKSIEDGYHGFMMQHKYPFTLLYLELDGEVVDVNVHPAKMELRFSNQEEIYHQLCLAIQNTLMHKEPIPEVTLEEEKKLPPVKPPVIPAKPEPFEAKRRQIEIPKSPVLQKLPEPKEKTVLVKEPQKTYAPLPKKQEPKIEKPEQLNLFAEKLAENTEKPSHRIVGQVFDTYWIIEYNGAMYIVDQHAAHEKVLYERLMKEYKEKEIQTQMISPPIVVSLTGNEQHLLEENMKVFKKAGYEIESFGGKDYQICGIPANLYTNNVDRLFRELLEELENTGKHSPEVILEELASRSCKAAVKGNQSLSGKEVESLLDELMTLENPYHCPHGRPTMISMTKYELDKKFKRIV